LNRYVPGDKRRGRSLTSQPRIRSRSAPSTTTHGHRSRRGGGPDGGGTDQGYPMDEEEYEDHPEDQDQTQEDGPTNPHIDSPSHGTLTANPQPLTPEDRSQVHTFARNDTGVTDGHSVGVGVGVGVSPVSSSQVNVTARADLLYREAIMNVGESYGTVYMDRSPRDTGPGPSSQMQGLGLGLGPVFDP